MAEIYYDKDADLSLLEGKTVAIIGFGSQGHAHALNLHDSGVRVVVGLREGSPSRERAREAGLEVAGIAEAAEAGDIVMMLVPDQDHREVYEKGVRQGLREGNALFFAHGFNVHYFQVIPPGYVDVVMVAPKGPGHMVRRMFQQGSGVPSLVAVHQDYTGQALQLGLAYAKGLGATRAGVTGPPLGRRRRPTSSGSSACSAAGLPSSSAPVSIPWWRRVTSRRSPTSSVSTS
jgi:ketol-acid reductoisomerase